MVKYGKAINEPLEFLVENHRNSGCFSRILKVEIAK